MRRIKINKPRGLQWLGYRLIGRGPWLVKCSSCPDTFIGAQSHEQAVRYAAAHLSGHAIKDAIDSEQAWIARLGDLINAYGGSNA